MNKTISPFWSGKSVLICGLLILIIFPLVQYFYKLYPNDANRDINESKEEEHEPGFFEGLTLLLKTPYLLGIFAIISFYELIITVYDYYFKIIAAAHFTNNSEYAAYLSQYGSLANTITLLLLIFGINNIQKYLGMTITLFATPFLVFLSVFFFKYYFSLNLMFYLMVAAKSINYALNGPSIKQLYLPTSKEARTQSQAWIETFGSRGAKATASLYTKQHGQWLKSNGPEWACKKFRDANVFSCIDRASLYHLALSTYIFFGITVVWLFIAYYLANRYNEAIKENKIIS
jgi:AAA family ATP:ADP antiporter